MKSKKYWILIIVGIVLGLVCGMGIGIGVWIHYETKDTNTQWQGEKESSLNAKETGTIAMTEEITTETLPPEPVEIAISDIPELDQLYSFLDAFEGYDFSGKDVNFDCMNPTDRLLDGFFNHTHAIVDTVVEDHYIDEIHEETVLDDPLGQFRDTYGYRRVEINGLNWVIQNVYNVPEDKLEQLEYTYLQEHSDMYEYDGYYYKEFWTGMGGLGSYHNIVSARYDGTYYYFEIDDYSMPDYNNAGNTIVGIEPWKARYELKMKRKEVDGIEFWSLYSSRTLMADWARAYYDYIQDDEWFHGFFDPEVNAMVYTELDIAYIDEDDIPELIFLRNGYGSGSRILSYQDGKVICLFDSFGEVQYQEKGNLIYLLGNRGNSVEWDAIYKIEDGEFVEVGEYFSSWIIPEEVTKSYMWEGEEVSKEQYESLCTSKFDFGSARDASETQMTNATASGILYNWLLRQRE